MTTSVPADPGVNFRLSREVWPRRYDVRLVLDLEHWRQRGSVAIELDVRTATSVVTLHALDLDVTSARLEGRAPGLPTEARVVVHPKAEAVSLCFPAPVEPGAATLRLAFTGEIVEKLRGLYRSVKDGERYAATQFEAADARRAFPCFDEPEYKARFALTLDVPADAAAIANGAVLAEEPRAPGRKVVRFAETPPISSYLVAFLVGPFEATPPVEAAAGTPVRVWLPRGLADKGLYARDAHRQAVEWLADYTGIPHPYGKIDAIGLADFEAGAMENPGAITYRLTAIAADPAEASTDTLKDIFYTAAHELTHMWWGDLVTMAWWNDLWLNESFATFVGWKATAELNPGWGMWRDFVATLSRPFLLDALVSTHPISFQVENARQAAERFDVITYWKGAGVVRMIERFLGADAFRAGVRSYLRRYAEKNATADDFWRELDQASGRDVTAIANAWIREPGHPVVEIASRFDATGATLRLRQRRFFSDPEMSGVAPAQRWPVPLVLKIGGATGIREERVLLAGDETEVALAGARWVFPNGGGAGFYRFALDDAAIARLAGAVATGLAPEERLSLVGNQWTLVKAGIGTVAGFVTLVRGFAGEQDRAVLEAISQRLAWLDTNVLADADRPSFTALVQTIFGPELAALGWDPRPGEPVDVRVKRAVVTGALGNLARDPAVLAEARARLERYLADRAALEPNLVPIVANLVAHDGDAALYERFLDRKRASAADDPEEEERFLLALAGFEDPALVARTLALTFTDDVRPQDRAFVLSRLLGGRASRHAAWRFVRDGWEARILPMDPMLRQYVIRGMSMLTPPEIAGAVGDFLAAHVTDDTRETTAQACEQLRIDAAAVLRLGPELAAALRAA
ncbi:MAG: M1 family metallopeptidase [Deltaproteobacteria bacterium]|nr:M1 family metallopeptidase [Deltaproteobacteria bacterium]